MPERRTIDQRLAALERRLDDQSPASDETGNEPSREAESTGREEVANLEARIETLESDIAELEAGLQALRGYVGNIEHVNETVERRANAAIAAVERLESAPKTPPPIATASATEHNPSTPPAERPEPGGENGETGLLDRLPALR